MDLSTLLPLIFLVAVVAYFVSRFRESENGRAKRIQALRQIAAQLDARLSLQDGHLAEQIKPLMARKDDFLVHETLQRPYRNGTIHIAEYSYHYQTSRSRRREYRAVVAIPIGEETGAVPEFYARWAVIYDGVTKLVGWPEVELDDNEAFNHKMSLKSRPEQVNAVRAFFEEREKLRDFCMRYDAHFLRSSGRWLVFFRTSERLPLSTADYKARFELAQTLYDTVWPID